VKAFSSHLCNCRESFLTPFCVGRCARPRVSIEINDIRESVYSHRQHGTIQSHRSQSITDNLTSMTKIKISLSPPPFFSSCRSIPPLSNPTHPVDFRERKRT